LNLPDGAAPANIVEILDAKFRITISAEIRF